MSYPIPAAPTGVDSDAWAAAIGAIRDHCGWHIAPEVTETVTSDSAGGSVIMLPTLRLVDLVSITDDGQAVTDPEWSAAGLVRGAWTRKYRGVEAEMKHGYDAWPAELLAVATAIITTGGREGVSSVAVGPHSVRFESSLTAAQVSILDRYRLVTIP